MALSWVSAALRYDLWPVALTLVALVGVTTCAAEVPLAKMRAGPAR